MHALFLHMVIRDSVLPFFLYAQSDGDNNNAELLALQRIDQTCKQLQQQVSLSSARLHDFAFSY
jgi:antitoxin component of RelBE/YafQ-DinJ toxin-antitoxin module